MHRRDWKYIIIHISLTLNTKSAYNHISMTKCEWRWKLVNIANLQHKIKACKLYYKTQWKMPQMDWPKRTEQAKSSTGNQLYFRDQLLRVVHWSGHPINPFPLVPYFCSVFCPFIATFSIEDVLYHVYILLFLYVHKHNIHRQGIHFYRFWIRL